MRWTRNVSRHMECPVLDSQRLRLALIRPALDSQRPALDSQRPALDSQGPKLDSQRPVFDSQRPALDLEPVFWKR